MNPFAGGKSSILSTLVLSAALSGCSTTLFSGDRVDYRSAATKMNPLEVPPDLAQLTRDGRYQQQRGVVSASAMPAGATTVRTNAPLIVPGEVAGYRVEKDEHQRWLSVPKPPEQVWSQIVSFWQDLGF
nr:outer membrane protein assembly factor BamC [Burkholderiaceae bacterium]